LKSKLNLRELINFGHIVFIFWHLTQNRTCFYTGRSKWSKTCIKPRGQGTEEGAIPPPTVIR